jgi:hypothetical protein
VDALIAVVVVLAVAGAGSLIVAWSRRSGERGRGDEPGSRDDGRDGS